MPRISVPRAGVPVILFAGSAAVLVAAWQLSPHNSTPTSPPVSASETTSSTAPQGATDDDAAVSPSTRPSQTGRPAPRVETTLPLRTASVASALPVPVASVVVHVAGLVRHPNVYTLLPSQRVVDAIHAAGGAQSEADLDAVNLAAHLQDGEQIYVPSRRAVEAAAIPTGRAATPRGIAAAPVLVRVPDGRAPLTGPLAHVRLAAGHASGASGGTASGSRTSHSNKLKDSSEGTVDLNTAGAEELERLPGVGPSMSARILEFRTTNGKFNAVEDLMSVKGIGPAKFAKMRPFLTAR